jgi:hypothetical protein
MAATSWRNKSSQTLPRPTDVLLQLRQRARGGGVPCGGSLYRSRQLGLHHFGWEVRFLAVWFKNIEAALGHVDDWTVDKARVSRGGICRRRRVPVEGRWSSGHVPGRCSFSVCFISLFGASVYCGYFQSLMAIGLPLIWDWRRRTSSDGRRQRSLEDSTGRGFRALFVISLFSRGLCAK